MASTKSSSSSMVDEAAAAYPYPHTVNVSIFISVKLSGHDNYPIWKTQMLCLLEGHDMLGFIDGTLEPPPETKPDNAQWWRRSDALLRGWILGSLSEAVLANTIGHKTAKDVWVHLEASYGSLNPQFGTSLVTKEEISGGEWKLDGALMRSTPHSRSLPAPLRGVSQQIDLKGDSAIPAADSQFNSRFRKSRGLDSLVFPEESWNGDSPKLRSMDLAEMADFLQETTTKINAYLPLYKAALRGDWEDAQDFIDQDEEAVTANINKYGFTALHIAVGTGKQGITFVEKLVEKISPKALVKMLTSSEKYTPLHIAAVVGNTTAVKILVNKNHKLLYAEDVDGLLPIHRALINSHKDTFLYLLGVTKANQYPNTFIGNMGVTLLSNVIFAGYFDIALDLVTRYPDLATTIPSDNVDAPLMAIARKADAFESGCRLSFFDSLIYKHVPLKLENLNSNKHQGEMNFLNSVLQEISFVIWKVVGRMVPRITYIQKIKLDHHQALELVKCLCQEISALNLHSNSIHYSNPIVEAASNGAYEVVQEIADTFPQAIWYSDKSGHFMIQLAILHRCEKVYNLTYQMSDHKHFHKTLKDSYNNNLLHLAGKLAPPQKLNLVSGAALQMQRELQWFKEVEAFVHPKYKTEKNSFEQTPEMLFSKEHKKLVRDGEEWMKKTADSYTVTAGLITTIVFAAAITVPGGNNGETGHPIYAKELSFLIFAVADAISLFTSTTSLLLFLSILTARYAEQDFLFTLPSRLIMGLATLFLSTTSMMIAFGASLYLLFGQGKDWILIPIAALSCLPVTCFVTLQFPLLVELISCTYGRGLFGRQNDRPFY
ncbi:ankyrin repeat-containing protein ITN1-like [Cynara cardunculus var. scolymus]|uniref:ankyrin repeat-containing protein ITN1-like n=1 Tax=Cynara cardunculus var. scolymus TaxID=59895 RepID=UPI000D627E7C|nr:ankyrin repeat-containing protein ITN1-like [Cynara cardunculus var. scolymus]